MFGQIKVHLFSYTAKHGHARQIYTLTCDAEQKISIEKSSFSFIGNKPDNANHFPELFPPKDDINYRVGHIYCIREHDICVRTADSAIVLPSIATTKLVAAYGKTHDIYMTSFSLNPQLLDWDAAQKEQCWFLCKSYFIHTKKRIFFEKTVEAIVDEQEKYRVMLHVTTHNIIHARRVSNNFDNIHLFDLLTGLIIAPYTL